MKSVHKIVSWSYNQFKVFLAIHFAISVSGQCFLGKVGKSKPAKIKQLLQNLIRVHFLLSLNTKTFEDVNKSLLLPRNFKSKYQFSQAARSLLIKLYVLAYRCRLITRYVQTEVELSFRCFRDKFLRSINSMHIRKHPLVL